MKAMTCKQLDGACDTVFYAGTFDEIYEIRKNHIVEMFMQRDKSHIKALNATVNHINSNDARNEWMKIKKEEFEKLPEYSHECGCNSCGCK